MKHTPDPTPSPQPEPKAAVETTFPTKLAILTLAYGCLFMIMLWAAYHNQLPLRWLAARLPHYDKIGHALLYCIPSYLGHRLCRHKHFHRRELSIPAFPFFFGLFTIAEELTQGLSPNRTLDAADLVCSLLGVAVGYWLAQKSRQ